MKMDLNELIGKVFRSGMALVALALLCVAVPTHAVTENGNVIISERWGDVADTVVFLHFSGTVADSVRLTSVSEFDTTLVAADLTTALHVFYLFAKFGEEWTMASPVVLMNRLGGTATEVPVRARYTPADSAMLICTHGSVPDTVSWYPATAYSDELSYTDPSPLPDSVLTYSLRLKYGASWYASGLLRVDNRLEGVGGVDTIPHAPATDKLCRVYGRIGNAQQALVGYATITFSLPDRVINICDSTVMAPVSFSCESGANGYFEIDLLRSSCLQIISQQGTSTGRAKYNVSIDYGGQVVNLRPLTVPDLSTCEVWW
jgi:hypothetical protein